MHTMMVIGGGLVLLVVFLLGARSSGGSLPKAALWFIPVWLVAAGVNLSVGVLHAGYTVMQELPVFLIVFGVPAAVALLLRQRFR